MKVNLLKSLPNRLLLRYVHRRRRLVFFFFNEKTSPFRYVLNVVSTARVRSRLPLTRDLPEFLSALSVGTPAIRVFFDIFIGQYHFKGPTPMIQIEHILDKEPISRQRCDEDLVHPLSDALAHGNFFARRRCAMPSDNDADWRHDFVQ